jgi:glucosamine--fructose-6-phosphate aminotransferase (isomerizing)
MQVRGAAMEREIRQQAELLQSSAAPLEEQALTALRRKAFDLVLLAARGSSDHAALYMRYLVEIHLGIPAILAAPSVITRFGSQMRYPRTLAIGISQSGAAPDVSEVLAAMRSWGHATLAITNTPGSRLAQEAEAAILLGAGPEESIAATKTYTLSLLALYQAARAMGAGLETPEGRLPGEAWVESAREWALEASGPVVRCAPVFSLGRGYGFSAAHEAALKLMECALIACKAYSTADFAHGPRALAGPESAAVVFGEVPGDLAATGCEILSAPEGDPGPLSPIWSVIAGQWLALHAARARGLDPDRARHLSKVTRTL